VRATGRSNSEVVMFLSGWGAGAKNDNKKIDLRL
jgi:hypothetical protein